MTTNNGRFYVFTDHPSASSGQALGSTSRLRKSGETGAFAGSTTRYLPYGGYRGPAPSQTLTDRDFTGQRENREIGLLYYNARFYIPGLGRFLSADTLVPNPTNPQSYNRYTYTLNNPVNFIDPSGHIACDSSYLPGMDQGACASGIDDFYPTQSRTASAIIGAGFSEEALPTELAHLDQSEVWDRFFRNVAGIISEPLDWLLTGKELLAGEASAEEAVVMILLAALPLTQGGFADDIGRYADDAVGTVCSFSGETPISTVNGLVAIDQISLGDYVLAYNEITSKLGYYAVLAVWVHKDPVIVYLTIDGETIETTPEHPFYREDGTWLAAANLQIGDKIRTATWGIGTVEAIHLTYQPQPMYNLTIATAHTYFVGDGQWLVHNVCIDDIPKIGKPGNNRGNRVVRGSVDDARQMFYELTADALDVDSQANGLIVAAMPDGSYVSFREVGSYKSGYVPTINVNSPKIGYWGIKFEP